MTRNKNKRKLFKNMEKTIAHADQAVMPEVLWKPVGLNGSGKWAFLNWIYYMRTEDASEIYFHGRT